MFLPTPPPPPKKKPRWGRQRVSISFWWVFRQVLGEAVGHLFLTKAQKSLECPLNNQRTTAISWAQRQQVRCLISMFVWAATVHLCVCVCVLRMCVYVQICMQSCVKFACWVHLYVSVCVCVSHDSRLIKLLHSNELWLSVWQLLWQPLFTTSPPTHIHTSAHTHKHTCIQVHAPTWGIPQLWKGFRRSQLHWCVVVVVFVAVVKSLGKLC